MNFQNKYDFFSYFLDDNWTISKKFLAEKNWIAVPVPDTLTLIESEWLANNIFLYGNKYLEYSFEFNGHIQTKEIDNNQENIFNSDFLNHHLFIILTNYNLDFLYFKNQDNLYHLFCGTPDFVFSCLNCSLTMAKKIFFSNILNNFDEDTDEFNYLRNIWFTYQNV